MLADELEAALRAAAHETLTLEEAARESGYSVAHLARLIQRGTIPNAGRKYAPRILRTNLPLRAAVLPGRADARISKAQIARSVVDSMRGHDDD